MELALCATACVKLTIWEGYTELQYKVDLEHGFCFGIQAANGFIVLQHWEEELKSLIWIWFNHGRKDSMKMLGPKVIKT